MSLVIRRRAACDRCHSQKLRCPKRPSQDACDRCLKASAICKFSPSARGYRSEHPKKSPESDTPSFDSPIAAFSPPGVTAFSKAEPTATSGNIDSAFELSVQNSFDDMISDWATQPPPLSSGLEDPSFDMDFLDQSFNPIQSYGMAIPQLHSHSSANNGMVNFEIEPPSYFETESAGKELDFQRTLELMFPLSDNQLAPMHASATEVIPAGKEYGPPDSPPEVPHHAHVRLLQDATKPSGSSCIRELADLSVKLLENAEAVPPDSLHEPLTRGGPSAFEVMMISGDSAVAGFDVEIVERRKDVMMAKNFTADKTYSLTQNLIDIYPRVMDTFIPGSSSTSLRTARLDHSAIHLLLSCHHRVIDIYESLFCHVRACAALQKRHSIIQSNNQGLQCAAVTIGSFQAQGSAAVKMQFILLLQFAGSLADRAYDLVKGIESMPKTSEDTQSNPNGEFAQQIPDSAFNATLLACKAAWGRAKSMSSGIANLRHIMSV